MQKNMKQLTIKLKDIDEHWKILTGSIIILISFGVLPSYWVCDWGWFSRSGALLVIYGIYIVWRDIKGDIHTVLNQVDAAASEKFGDKSEEITGLIKGFQKYNKRLYDTIEFLIVGAGTIIWAYGDLINNVYS